MRTGSRSTSRAQSAARISLLRRTCQMVNGRAPGLRDSRRASARLTGAGQPGRATSESAMS